MPSKKDSGSWERVEAKIDLFKDHFDKHMAQVGGQLEKMDTKIEKVDTRIDNVDVTVAKQQVVLEDHVKRSNLLEEKMEKDKKEVKEELEPIKAHVSQVKLFMKIAGWVLGGGLVGGGLGVGIKELIHLIFG